MDVGCGGGCDRDAMRPAGQSRVRGGVAGRRGGAKRASIDPSQGPGSGSGGPSPRSAASLPSSVFVCALLCAPRDPRARVTPRPAAALQAVLPRTLCAEHCSASAAGGYQTRVEHCPLLAGATTPPSPRWSRLAKRPPSSLTSCPPRPPTRLTKMNLLSIAAAARRAWSGRSGAGVVLITRPPSRRAPQSPP